MQIDHSELNKVYLAAANQRAEDAEMFAVQFIDDAYVGGTQTDISSIPLGAYRESWNGTVGASRHVS